VTQTFHGVTRFAVCDGQLRETARLDSVFAFFSNRLGCLGSIVVSIIGTLILLAVMRGCSGGW
jgi:hypothetical protein